MSKKPRSQKAAKTTKAADIEIFEDRSPQERGYLGIYETITPKVLKNARESVQTGNMLDRSIRQRKRGLCILPDEQVRHVQA